MAESSGHACAQRQSALAPLGRAVSADAPEREPRIGNTAVATVIRRLGAGRPLDPRLRGELEPAFGHDLGAVMIHDDAAARRSAVESNARAFTYGEHIVFDSSLRNVLERIGGRKLLAHELAHVIQQRRGGGRDPSPAPAGPVEAEAAGAASAVASGGTTPALGGTAVGLARAAGQDPAGLTEAELASEHQGAQRWLLDHRAGDPGYQDTLEYFQRLEQQVWTRPAPSGRSAAPGAAGSLAASPPEAPPSGPKPMSAPVESAPPPGGGSPAASFDQNAPVAPEDMVTHLLNQRGFTRNHPEILNAPGEPLGTGYSTNSMAQVMDGQGKQVAIEWSQYSGSGSEHAEAQALGALRARLAGMKFPGGKLVVAVDQKTCSGCTELIRAFARDHGLELIEVYGPTRGRIANPDVPVSPKTAARTAYSGLEEAPPTQAELLWGESVGPSAPGAAGGASGAAAAGAGAGAAETGGAGAAPETAPTGKPAAPTPKPGAPAEPLTTPAAPPESLATPAPPEPSTTKPTGAPGAVGEPGVVGAVATNVVVPLVLGYVHDKATRDIRDRRGYAPVGVLAYAHENILSRLGRVLTGAPVEEMTADLPARFNVTAFRANARAQAAQVQPGQPLLLICQVPVALGETSMQEVKNAAFTYRKGADGTWTLDRNAAPPDFDKVDTEHVLVAPLMPTPVGGGMGRVDPPDMNVILGTGTDRDVGGMFRVLPEQRSTAGEGASNYGVRPRADDWT